MVLERRVRAATWLGAACVRWYLNGTCELVCARGRLPPFSISQVNGCHGRVLYSWLGATCVCPSVNEALDG